MFATRELASFGYPAGHELGDGLKFEPEFFTGKTGWNALKLSKAKPSPGHSGSGLLNMRTKAICGILYSRDEPEAGTDATRAVPIEYAVEYWPEIAQRSGEYHTSHRTWSDLLPHRRLALNMAVVRERMIREDPHIEEQLAPSPLEAFWRQFIKAEPWCGFIRRQIATVNAHADMLDEESVIQSQVTAVSFGRSYEDTLPALRAVASDDRRKQATDLRGRLQREYDRLRNPRFGDAKPDTAAVNEAWKNLLDARRLTNALWTLKNELEQPSFQRAYLVMGSLGYAGKSHFIGGLLAAQTNDALVVPFTPADFAGSPSTALISKLSAMAGVDWKDLADVADLLGGTQPSQDRFRRR